MRALRLAAALLPLLPASCAAPLFVGVVPDLPGTAESDEGFAVQGEDTGGLSVTDGEGILTFPPGTDATSGVWAVGNLTAWRAHQGPEPAFEWTGRTVGDFRLGNAGDALRLLSPTGDTLDAFAWGDAPDGPAVAFTSPGLVYQRRTDANGSFVDTDRAEDWVTPREHRVGESRLDQPTFNVSRLTLYASPDSSYGVLTGLVAAAHRRLHLHVYELGSVPLAQALAEAARSHPGLDLQVLVEGAPVGQSASHRALTRSLLRFVEAAGGEAWLAGNGRYDYHHLKVLVADDAVAVQSENWVESGVPRDVSWGNRGWGMVVHDAAAADWFAGWMAADRAAWDCEPFEANPGEDAPLPPVLPPRSGEYGPPVPAVELTGSFQVTPIVSPDHTADPARDPVAALAAGARRRVWTQQLDLATGGANDLGWSGPDPLTAALAAAAAAGADVRVLSAAPFFSDDEGNQRALDELAAAGAATHTLDRPGLAVLHNKGIIADDAVVVGSMNGNHHSRSANREASVVVRGPGVAEPYASLFAGDWGGTGPPRDISVVEDDLRGVPAAPWPTLFALAGVVVALRRRR